MLLLASPSLAQEPARLERLAGPCRVDGGAELGRYEGRVLWTTDGQLSGMVRRDPPDAAAADAASLPPTTLNIPRQTPDESGDGGLTLRTEAMIASRDGKEIVRSAIVCALAGARPERPDPGATSRG